MLARAVRTPPTVEDCGRPAPPSSDRSGSHPGQPLRPAASATSGGSFRESYPTARGFPLRAQYEPRWLAYATSFNDRGRRPVRRDAVNCPPMARTAIIVFHGIGQQQEFDTIESVARALVDREGFADTPIRVNLVAKGDDPVAAATVRLGDKDVDLYEAYWSPWTKGKASTWTIFWFLVMAGLRGLATVLFRRARFQRFLFGKSE